VLASSTLRRYPVGSGWKDVTLVACSTACRDGLAPLVGVPAEDIEVLHSPVDTADVVTRGGAGAAASDGSPTLVVGACGVVNERKGADLWVEMAKLVIDKRPDLSIRFVWVGRQPRDWPQDRARELGIADEIEWTGETGEPYPALAAMDVFTLPSREDPFPLVVLEAMALGRPIVAFDVGGVREQLGDAGAIVAAEQPEALAEAVIDLLDDPGARSILGTAAATRVADLYDTAPFHTHTLEILAPLTDRSHA
jgi:glycosyltransferase involved in cell wall biosynthesis